MNRFTRLMWCLALFALLLPGKAAAQDAERRWEVYGFVQLDFIQDFNRVDPAWVDALRPSKIPTQSGLYGEDFESSFSAKQSRLGVKADFPTSMGTLKTKFEFDFFGVGADAGQMTIRPRHFWGELGKIGAGQTNSNFMDVDVFPNTIDYWGPAGMPFFRLPQLRFTPVQGDNEFALALEKPGTDIDTGDLGKIDPSLENVQAHNYLPDFTVRGRVNRGWGHFQAAGILRKLGYETLGTPDNEPNGSKTGWGLHGSAVINTVKKDQLHASVVYGQGIGTYMNDGGTDLAAETSDNVAEAKAVYLLGLVAYYDHYWNDRFATSLGYSTTSVDNTDLQSASSFKRGHYASANLLWTPVENYLVGGEVLWGRREDHNGAAGDDVRFQLTFKYNFGMVHGAHGQL